MLNAGLLDGLLGVAGMIKLLVINYGILWIIPEKNPFVKRASDMPNTNRFEIFQRFCGANQ